MKGYFRHFLEVSDFYILNQSSPVDQYESDVQFFNLIL